MHTQIHAHTNTHKIQEQTNTITDT